MNIKKFIAVLFLSIFLLNPRSVSAKLAEFSNQWSWTSPDNRKITFVYSWNNEDRTKKSGTTCDYYPGKKQSWATTESQVLAVDVYMYALKYVVQDILTDPNLKSLVPSGYQFDIYNASTTCARDPIMEFPPHVNLHYHTGWKYDTNAHFEARQKSGVNVPEVYHTKYNMSNVCGVNGRQPDAAPNEWTLRQTGDCKKLMDERFTSDYVLELRMYDSAKTLYRLKGEEGSNNINVYKTRNGITTKIYSVKRASYAFNSTIAKTVFEIKDYRNSKLITETLNGDTKLYSSGGKITRAPVVTSTALTATSASPTPTRIATPTSNPTPTKAPVTPTPTTVVTTMRKIITSWFSATVDQNKDGVTNSIDWVMIVASRIAQITPTVAQLSPTRTTSPTSAQAGSGCTHYVSPGGSGSDWTMSEAVSQAKAGNTVCIRDGVYKGRFTIANSGNSGAYITFKALNPSKDISRGAILDEGADSNGNYYGGIIHIVDKSYIHIEGLVIKNSGNAGVFVNRSHHIRIINNRIDNTFASGIFTNNDVASTSSSGTYQILIDGNEITRATHGRGGTIPGHRVANEIISLRGVYGFELKNNYLHSIRDGFSKEGIDAKSGASNGSIHHNRVDGLSRVGIYVDAYDKGVSNIDVYANTVSRSQHGIMLAAEKGNSVNNVKIYNNVVYDNEYDGLRLQYSSGYGPVRNAYFYNNTSVGNLIGIRIRPENIDNIVLKNNIVYNNGTAISDGNSPKVTKSNNLTSNPHFVSLSGENFRLTANSPAINAGTSSIASGISAPSTDRDGKARSGNPDIGAYEY